MFPDVKKTTDWIPQFPIILGNYHDSIVSKSSSKIPILRKNLSTLSEEHCH